MGKKSQPVRSRPSRTKAPGRRRNARGQRASSAPPAIGRFTRTKRVFAVVGALAGAAALFALYLYVWVVPRDEIARLANGYVAVSYGNNRVRYAPVAAMPKDWTPLKAMSKKTAAAFVLSEDARFYQHHGIDFYEIENALVAAVYGGTHPRGASTITQQVAKNLFLDQTYSLWRKVKEAAIALEMDRALPKEKILEVYLNTIEYGEGLYGITRASRHYFGKEPAQLTPKEAAFLATLLPSPKRYSQDLREAGLTKQARDRIDDILVAMRWLDYLSFDEFQRETDAPLKFTNEALGVAPR